MILNAIAQYLTENKIPVFKNKINLSSKTINEKRFYITIHLSKSTNTIKIITQIKNAHFNKTHIIDPNNPESLPELLKILQEFKE